MDKIVFEKKMNIEREKLNQVIIENNYNMAAKAVIEQSQVVDVYISKLQELNFAR